MDPCRLRSGTWQSESPLTSSQEFMSARDAYLHPLHKAISHPLPGMRKPRLSLGSSCSVSCTHRRGGLASILGCPSLLEPNTQCMLRKHLLNDE
jgi:hypothetical protein